MPYSITKTDGTALSTIADGTVDQSTSLKLIGKNYAGYGEIQNENFVYLLENFSNTSSPSKPLAGQLWFDSANKKLKFFDGDSITGKWRTTGGAEIGATEPTGLSIGDFWFNTTTKQLYAYSGNGVYTLVGPQAALNQGTTQMISRSVLDTNGSSHAIIEAKTNNITQFILTNDAFTLGSTNLITGFSGPLRPGVNLIYTEGADNNNSPINGKGISTGEQRYWGTASNSDKLGGVDASLFVKSTGDQSFAGLVKFRDPGFIVGNSDTLKVSIENSIDAVIENVAAQRLIFRTKTSGVTNYPLSIIGTDILPGGSSGSNFKSNGVNNLGASDAKWATVYATTFNGVATKADTLSVSGTYYTADLSATASTIAVRDNNGDITANHFRGIASQSFYADLAEKYLADAEYEVGTVVAVGGEKEVTACHFGDRALGVVSGQPAYMMNSELVGGTYIALKGRVPVKVTGPVTKGDRLIAFKNGTARSTNTNELGDDTNLVPANVFAIALESSDDAGIKLVEAVVL